MPPSSLLKPFQAFIISPTQKDAESPPPPETIATCDIVGNHNGTQRQNNCGRKMPAILPCPVSSHFSLVNARNFRPITASSHPTTPPGNCQEEICVFYRFLLLKFFIAGYKREAWFWIPFLFCGICGEKLSAAREEERNFWRA